MIPEEIVKHYEDLIVENGTPVALNSGECVIWRLEHGDLCGGCAYELGCSKLVALSRILSIRYMPRSEVELDMIMQQMNYAIHIILSATTKEEIADM